MKLKVKTVVRTLNGLRALDGPSPGTYKFAPAFVWKTAKNIIALEAVEAVFNKARQQLIKEVTGGVQIKPEELEGKREQIKLIADRVEELMEQEEEVVITKIAFDDLKLDANNIPPTVLADLGPILQME